MLDLSAATSLLVRTAIPPAPDVLANLRDPRARKLQTALQPLKLVARAAWLPDPIRTILFAELYPRALRSDEPGRGPARRWIFSFGGTEIAELFLIQRIQLVVGSLPD